MYLDNPPAEQPAQKPWLAEVGELLERGHRLSAKGEVQKGLLSMWVRAARSRLRALYGDAYPLQDLLPDPPDGRSPEQYAELLKRHIPQMEAFVALMHSAPAKTLGQNASKVFFGHGRSPLWREFKDFVNDRLGLPWDEFNRDPAAGLMTFERLAQMLASASFAFLVMTAEDEHADGSLHARENVIHEAGLFQSHLGPRRAILILEDGCKEFSNIVGLTQIRFPHGHARAAFEEMRGVHQREGLI